MGIIREGLYNIANYGAVGDKKTLNTVALQGVIDACAKDGGGTVFCPPGDYVTGTIFLKDNVSLYLSPGCVIWASTDMKDAQAPIKGDSRYITCLIGAANASNISITGTGRIDGQGDFFWDKREPSTEDNFYNFHNERIGWGQVAQEWRLAKDRYAKLVLFTNCRHGLIENISLTNAPCWTVHLHGCNDMFIRGITINDNMYGPNTDGIDIDSCEHVIVSDCNIYCGDDAIVLKSTGANGVVRSCRDIAVTNCRLTTCCNAFKMGTESIGGFENITFSNSVISNEDTSPELKALGGIVIESTDGGHNNNIAVSNIAMLNVRAPFFVFLGGRGRRPGVGGSSPEALKARDDFKPGSMKNLIFNNITAQGAVITSSITGMPGFEIDDISFNMVNIEYRGGMPEDLSKEVVPERPKAYPETTVYGKGAAGGLYFRHVRNLSMSQVSLRAREPDGRPVIILDDVRTADLSGIRATRPASGQPVIRTSRCDDLFVDKCRPEISIREVGETV
ncbi:MAG: hypothetical protein LBK43_03985 [Treponema sp.]|jgi:polygalacturonase|nr:hypothetical protein [Treponema sp.]